MLLVVSAIWHTTWSVCSASIDVGLQMHPISSSQQQIHSACAQTCSALSPHPHCLPSQVVAYMHSPFVITSNVEWSDTQGPFAMVIKCASTSGCLVSNRHNDSLSSHHLEVDPAQNNCMFLAANEAMTINATYTHNPLSGLVALWDPRAPVIAGQPRGAGLAIRSQTNCPSCLGGIALMWAPALAGSYLVSGTSCFVYLWVQQRGMAHYG